MRPLHHCAAIDTIQQMSNVFYWQLCPSIDTLTREYGTKAEHEKVIHVSCFVHLSYLFATLSSIDIPSHSTLLIVKRGVAQW